MSKKARPKWKTGDAVILAQLATNTQKRNDHCIYGRGIVDVEHRKGIDELPNWLERIPGINHKQMAYIQRWPYIIWLKDVELVDGHARDAVWLSELNDRLPEPVVAPKSLGQKSYIKLDQYRLEILNLALTEVFERRGVLKLSAPENLWWNEYIHNQSYHLNRKKLEQGWVPSGLISD